MGLTISYTATLNRRTAIAPFLAAARKEAKALGWPVPRAKAGSQVLEVYPHPESEPVIFDFSKSLTCEHFVKTSFAPLRTHIQVVEFLRSLQPLLKSLTVEDECEYWDTGDRKLLKQHRDGFDSAIGRKPSTGTVFLMGALTVNSSGEVKRGPNPQIVHVDASGKVTRQTKRLPKSVQLVLDEAVQPPSKPRDRR